MRKLPSIGTVIFQTSEQIALFVLLYSDFYICCRPGVNPPSTIPNPIPVDFLIPNPIPVNLAMIPNPIPIPVIFPSAIPNPNPISSY